MSQSRGLAAFIQQQQRGAPWGPNAVRDGVDQRLLQFLDRVHPEIPGGFNVTSGYRDPDRNRRVGGASGSRHIRGEAIDVSGFRDDAARAAFLERAAREGQFRGVGVYPGGSIHIDTRETPAAWGPNGYRGSPVDTFPTWAQPHVRSILGLPPGAAMTPTAQATAAPRSIMASQIASLPADANIRATARPSPDSDPTGAMGSQRPLGLTLSSPPAAVAGGRNAPPAAPTGGDAPAAVSPTPQTADVARSWRNPMGTPTPVVNNTPVTETFDPNNIRSSLTAMGQNTNFTGGIAGILKAMAPKQAPQEAPIQSSLPSLNAQEGQRMAAAQQLMSQLVQKNKMSGVPPTFGLSLMG